MTFLGIVITILLGLPLTVQTVNTLFESSDSILAVFLCAAASFARHFHRISQVPPWCLTLHAANAAATPPSGLATLPSVGAVP